MGSVQELIRGKVVPLSIPKLLHGLIVAIITARLLGYFVMKGKLGKVFCNDAGIIVERDPDTVRGPDVGFISAGRSPVKDAMQQYMEVAPELCVEVVSPSDRWSEITEKVDMFLDKGVAKLVWVVDPKTRKAHVYRKGRETLIVETSGALSGEDVLPGFSLPLKDVFSVLDE